MLGNAAELQPNPQQSFFYSQLLGLWFCIRIGCYLAHFASMKKKLKKKVWHQGGLRIVLSPILDYIP